MLTYIVNTKQVVFDFEQDFEKKTLKKGKCVILLIHIKTSHHGINIC